MNTKRLLYIVIGPVLFALSVLLFSEALGTAGAQAVGVLIWMIFWWVTRPVHMTVTALVPIAANALFNIIDMGTVTSQYFSDSIVLILGSCLLTIPWQSTGLDKRVALKILSIVGPTIKSQIIVWLLASMVFSTVLPNIAVCALFCPIAVAMLHAAGYKDISKAAPAVPILLCIGWGAGLGGVGSPLGGAMNVAAISFLEEAVGHEFMYIDWVIRILPYFIISAIVMLLMMIFMFKKTEQIQGTKEYFEQSLKELGPMKREEAIVGILFILALLGAFLRPLYEKILPGLAPAYVFVILGSLSFFIPIKKEPILTWEAAQKDTLWGMMLLFGGGLALGKLVNESGAGASIAGLITDMNLTGGFLTILVFSLIAILISEATNSTVSAAVIIPIILSFTSQMGLNPIPYWFAGIMAYNAEFLLPISVRAVPCSYGLDASHLIKKGVPMVLARLAVVLIVGYVCINFWPMFSDIPYLNVN